MQIFAGNVIVHVLQFAVLDIQAVAAVGAAERDQRTLRAALRDLHLGGDAVRTVEQPRASVERHGLGAWVEGVAGAVGGDLRALFGKALRAAPVDRHHIVLAGLHIPHADHLDQLGAIFGRHVVVFGEILLHVVQLPAVGVQLGQRVPEMGVPKNLPASVNDGPGHGQTARQPS